MNRKNKQVVLIASIVLFLAALVIFCMTVVHNYPYWFGLNNWKLYANVNVTNNASGFDLNVTALTFGKIGLQSLSVTRTVNFTNGYSFPVVLKISTEGNIATLLTYEQNILVNSGETKKIGFSVISSNETSLGVHDGFVKFKVVPAQ